MIFRGNSCVRARGTCKGQELEVAAREKDRSIVGGVTCHERTTDAGSEGGEKQPRAASDSIDH